MLQKVHLLSTALSTESSWLCSSHIPFSFLPKIQLSAKDFENEKIDRQSMQHQLHKVLKELRKARDQIAKLESAVSVSVYHNHMFIVKSVTNNSSLCFFLWLCNAVHVSEGFTSVPSSKKVSTVFPLQINLKCSDSYRVFQKQPNSRFSEPSSYNNLEFERLTINDHHAPTSPSKATNLLDESFLECPKCRAPYPTSRHRELLAHIDYCFAWARRSLDRLFPACVYRAVLIQGCRKRHLCNMQLFFLFACSFSPCFSRPLNHCLDNQFTLTYSVWHWVTSRYSFLLMGRMPKGLGNTGKDHKLLLGNLTFAAYFKHLSEKEDKSKRHDQISTDSLFDFQKLPSGWDLT